MHGQTCSAKCNATDGCDAGTDEVKKNLPDYLQVCGSNLVCSRADLSVYSWSWRFWWLLPFPHIHHLFLGLEIAQNQTCYWIRIYFFPIRKKCLRKDFSGNSSQLGCSCDVALVQHSEHWDPGQRLRVSHHVSSYIKTTALFQINNYYSVIISV